MADEPGEVTRLLQAVRNGDDEALERLVPVVYDELRVLARARLRGQSPGHTFQTADLVHQAYFKLTNVADIDWQGRAHFFGVASRAMRQVLVDHARRKSAEKRGGEWHRTTLSGNEAGLEVKLDEILSLDQALERLPDERQRKVVEYRFFGGMTEEEIAQVLGVSTRSVERDWVKARAWLYRELYEA